MSKAITHFLAAPTRNNARLLATGALVLLLLLLGVVSIADAQQDKTSSAKTAQATLQKLFEKQTQSPLLQRLGLDSERMAALRTSFAEQRQQLANLPPGSPERLQKYKEMRQAMMVEWRAIMAERQAEFKEQTSQAKLQKNASTNNQPKPE